MAKTVCIPAAEAKKLGITAKAKAMTQSKLLSTPEGKSYVRAKKALKAERARKNSSCDVLTTLASKVASSGNSLLDKHGTQIHGDLRKRVMKDVNSLLKNFGTECSRRAKSEANRAKKASGLQGLRRRRR